MILPRRKLFCVTVAVALQTSSSSRAKVPWDDVNVVTVILSRNALDMLLSRAVSVMLVRIPFIRALRQVPNLRSPLGIGALGGPATDDTCSLKAMLDFFEERLTSHLKLQGATTPTPTASNTESGGSQS